MKRFVSVLLSLVIISLLFSLPIYADETAINLDDYPVLTYRSDFLWGQNMHNNRRGFDSPDEYSEEAIYYAAKMGCKLMRYQGQYLTDDFTETDRVIGLCNKYGMKVMLCLFPETVDEPTQSDLDDITYYVKTFANRYNGKNGRGKVDYFQLWNELEIDLMSAKYGTSGATQGDSTANYYCVSVEGKGDLVEWTKNMKAAIKGLKEADTDAKSIINFSWKAFGCVKYYYENGVDFDIVGWDWYASTYNIKEHYNNFWGVMHGWNEVNQKTVADVPKDTAVDVDGNIITITDCPVYIKNDGYFSIYIGNERKFFIAKSVSESGNVLMVEATPYNEPVSYHKGVHDVFPDKDVIFCEANSWVQGWTDYDNPMPYEKYEPFWLTMKMAYKEPWIKGLCAFKLTQSPNHSLGHEKNYGFLEVEKNSIPTGKIIGPLPIYYTYQKMIGGNNNIARISKASIDLKPYEVFKVRTAIDNTNYDDVSEGVIGSFDFSDVFDDDLDVFDDDSLVEGITKKLISTITTKKMPWVLLISVGGGMLVLFAAGFAIFLIIRKKKGI